MPCSPRPARHDLLSIAHTLSSCRPVYKGMTHMHQFQELDYEGATRIYTATVKAILTE